MKLWPCSSPSACSGSIEVHPFEADLASALKKIQELMPEEVSVSPEALDAALSLDLGPTYATDPAVFTDLLTALRRRSVAIVRYRSLNSNRVRDRRLHPYHIFNYRGDWYAAAWDEDRQTVRDFAIHRMRRVTLTTESYVVPLDYDYWRYLADAFGIEKGTKPVPIAIRFGPRISSGYGLLVVERPRSRKARK